jgi:hypothetical protein
MTLDAQLKFHAADEHDRLGELPQRPAPRIGR